MEMARYCRVRSPHSAVLGRLLLVATTRWRRCPALGDSSALLRRSTASGLVGLLREEGLSIVVEAGGGVAFVEAEAFVASVVRLPRGMMAAGLRPRFAIGDGDGLRVASAAAPDSKIWLRGPGWAVLVPAGDGDGDTLRALRP